MNKIVEKFKVKHNTQEGDCCPECNANWDGGDILEDLVRRKEKGEVPFVDKSDEELIEYASSYGWTPETPVRWGKVIGMELAYDDPEHYDGVSYWACPECGIAWDRWTGDRSDRFVDAITERNKKIDIMAKETTVTNDNNTNILGGENEEEENVIVGIGLKIDDDDKKHI